MAYLLSLSPSKVPAQGPLPMLCYYTNDTGIIQNIRVIYRESCHLERIILKKIAFCLRHFQNLT